MKPQLEIIRNMLSSQEHKLVLEIIFKVLTNVFLTISNKKWIVLKIQDALHNDLI